VDDINPIRDAMGQGEDWYRSQFLPVKTRKGEWDWDVPGIIREPWNAWKRQWDSALGYGEGVTPDQVFEDATSVAGVMMPGALARGGVARGAGSAMAEAENPIYETLRRLEQAQKPMSEAEKANFWKWHQDNSSRKPVHEMTDTELAAELDRVAPLQSGEPRYPKRATHSAYAEDIAKPADDWDGDWTQKPIDPNFDWRKHVRVRNADNSDMTPIDHAMKKGAMGLLDESEAVKAEKGIKEDWMGGDRPELPQQPYVMPSTDEYLSQMQDMLKSPEDIERHYRTLINEIRIGERMEPGEVAWLENYERQYKPRVTPNHPGNTTLHAGSPFAGLIGSDEEQR